MGWSERQVTLLREMGITVWAPPEPEAFDPPVLAVDPEPADTIVEASTVSVTRVTVDLTTAGWVELRASVATCTTCTLHAGRRQPVFGAGPEQADWMIVGEAPGEQEDEAGEPFAGKPGQLLDNMLRAIGLSRDQVFLANTVKCRPPGGRNPTPTELEHCGPFLQRQRELVRPKIVLAMGRHAVARLLDTEEPIGKLRGRLHDWHGTPLLVTYHPAYLLRNPEDKAKAWEDLCLARATVQGTSST